MGPSNHEQAPLQVPFGGQWMDVNASITRFGGIIMRKSKSFDGLDIMDTKIMNISHMAKWIWKLYAGEHGL
jgi:hypothetical protein